MQNRPLLLWEKNHLEDCKYKNLFKGKKVLEIGGVIPQKDIEHLNIKSWTSIDPWDKYKNYENGNYRVINDCINNYEFEDESFDLIISTNSFEHIKNLDKTLEKTYKILKKGGYLSPFLDQIKRSFTHF